ncbi:MAG TPA: response regulator transcription factor [Flavipsychrobacter sp.]|nr:response regulator transcription factor [Flavipsychrobacter sp.]
MPITVSLVDDHPLAISGLKNMLEATDEIEVADTYANGKELLEALPNKQPDVLLLDLLLPGQSGQELTSIIHKKYPQIKILIITSLDAPTHVKALMRAGCNGYILKNTDVQLLVEAIKQVYGGETFVQPELKEQMLNNVLLFRKSSKPALPNLTSREKQILGFIVEEYTNQQIAEKLSLSLRTIENHRFSIMHKLDAKNSVGLVRAAIELGIF